MIIDYKNKARIRLHRRSSNFAREISENHKISVTAYMNQFCLCIKSFAPIIFDD